MMVVTTSWAPDVRLQHAGDEAGEAARAHADQQGRGMVTTGRHPDRATPTTDRPQAPIRNWPGRRC